MAMRKCTQQLQDRPRKMTSTGILAFIGDIGDSDIPLFLSCPKGPLTLYIGTLLPLSVLFLVSSPYNPFSRISSNPRGHFPLRQIKLFPI